MFSVGITLAPDGGQVSCSAKPALQKTMGDKDNGVLIMAENDVMGEMRQIVGRLNAAADAYYNGRGELMTDFEWDALFDRLKALEAESGIVLPDSPTVNVSADDVVGKKEGHEFPALSLAKTKSVAAVAKWTEGRPIWLSWKLDGLTLVVTYDEGKLTKVVTRGDGHVGTNITHLAGGIEGIPAKVDGSGHLVIRGEAVISYSDFEAFCADSEEEYANPRNLAAGSLTLKDVAELKLRHLRWIPFTLVSATKEIVSWGARMDYLDSLGFGTVERERIDMPSEAAISAVVGRWTEKVTGRGNPYPVDGLVVTYDDTEYAKTGSVTGHHATRGGFAFKWQDEAAETTLDHIEWSPAVGSISPVAVFAGVQLEGTEVRRASLCNVSECERLGIGGEGTKLKVIKANKIIPKVIAVTERVGRFEVPSECPVCGRPTEVVESVTGTRTLKCTNAGCPARELAKFKRFVSADCMDIEGLAGETLAKFIAKGWIKSFGDIFRLGAKTDEIAVMEGFGRKSAENLRAAIEKARVRPANRFLMALSIPLCGHDVSKRLLGAMGLRELLARAKAAKSGDEFASIDGIGPVKSEKFVAWCQDEANQASLDDLLAEVTPEDVKAAGSDGRCAGLTFVVTGDVHHFPNRDALKEYVEREGGKVSGSVSGKTSYLINNDINSTSGKNKKAKELGVPIISEDQFCEQFCR